MDLESKKFDKAFKIFVVLVLTYNFFQSGSDSKAEQARVTRLIKDDNSISDIKLMKKNVCFTGFKSILDRFPNKDFVRTEIVNHLKEKGYSNFDVEASDYLHVELISNAICRAIIKNKDEQFKSFDVEIAKSNDYPFLYFVYDVNEREYRGGI